MNTNINILQIPSQPDRLLSWSDSPAYLQDERFGFVDNDL